MSHPFPKATTNHFVNNQSTRFSLLFPANFILSLKKRHRTLIFSISSLLYFIKIPDEMAQKVVLKVLTMTDDKTKQKAIEAAADIFGEYRNYFLPLNYYQLNFDSSFYVIICYC
ncbi:Copper transport protein family [Hirschfeldia incana]|nr:Copper transport protein family [Hirschfeldia incana]